MLSRTVMRASLGRMNISILISDVRIPRAESARCMDTTCRRFFATPEKAKAATVLLGDLNRMEARSEQRLDPVLRC